MGKINRDELKEMIKAGNSQSACARYFGTSEAAVSKALKRLKALTLPPSVEKLTSKRRAFALNCASGKTAIESALSAFDCKTREVAKTIGSRLLKEPDINTAIADLLAQEGLSKRHRIRRLKVLIDSSDLTAVKNGLEIANKLDGSYIEKHLLGIVDYRGILADLNIHETKLQARLQELESMEPEEQEE